MSPEVAAELGDRLESSLEEVSGRLDEWLALDLAAGRWLPPAEETARLLAALERDMGQVPHLCCLVNDEALAGAAGRKVDEIGGKLGELEQRLEESASAFDAGTLESANSALVMLKDELWALGHDRLGAADEIRRLAGSSLDLAAAAAWQAIQITLSALDRLEVRGRDSAGLHLWVSKPGIDPGNPEVDRLLRSRSGGFRFGSGAVQAVDGCLGFVYKTAAEIGELGDNGRQLRDELRADRLLHQALTGSEVEVTVLGHTRWASVGLISEPNAHPLDGQEVPPRAGSPAVVAALNGDVDNYADLIAEASLALPDEITTDAKVIPVLMARRLAEGRPGTRAFLETASALAGSVAVAASTAVDPDKVFLALRGSGQALYVGLRDEMFVVSSEPYGLVAETSDYLRLDGETPGNPDNPSASRGQVVVLDRRRAGELAGLERWAYDGTALPPAEDELAKAQITTRDVDRGRHPHFLIKEIFEAPASFQKTLRGKLLPSDHVALGATAIPAELEERWRRGTIAHILVIGQGTAAIAASGIAGAFKEVLAGGAGPSDIRALPATELSGFELRDDMSDTLVVAVSQSGTTTDTNRTVDLVRARGALVVSIVNRRHSDLTSKSDGVLYTSDGRDVEMSVASTKAFYSQIAAGFLLAFALVDLGRGPDEALDEGSAALRRALREMPAAMRSALERSQRIGEIAARHAPSHRYWAVVGNGPNRTAAEEVRIKLSELCYKSIACDVTEDKKHIDLSSEPLILVCATGLAGSTADDVAKEVAIFGAHKAVPIVIGSEGETRFKAAVETIEMPSVHPSLDFVLSALAGHLFGYHAALAIDRQAVPLRRIRARLERQVAALMRKDDLLANDPLASFQEAVRDDVDLLLGEIRSGSYDGHLEASTAVDLALLLRIAGGSLPFDGYQQLRESVARPAVFFEDLATVLTRAIDELTRPVDAIKHQAKTVTVGISRAEEALTLVPLVAALFEAGADRDRISYQDLRALAALDPAVASVLGFTRYELRGDAGSEERTIRVVGRGGISREIASRCESAPGLKGTKRRVASEQRLLVARGMSDGRVFILVPEVGRAGTSGLTLLHVRFKELAPASVLRGVLRQYRNRYALLRDAVMETEPEFDERLLETVSVERLLIEPLQSLVDHWSRRRPELSKSGSAAAGTTADD